MLSVFDLEWENTRIPVAFHTELLLRSFLGQCRKSHIRIPSVQLVLFHLQFFYHHVHTIK